MERIVEPEILDELPANDPRALRSRRDLRYVNAWMGHARIIEAALREAFPHPPRRLVEIGAGDGTLMLKVARRLAPDWKDVELTLVDQRDTVSTDTLRQFTVLGWEARSMIANVAAWLSLQQSSDCVLANLFLHHFKPDEMRAMLANLSAHTNCFVACEPRRARSAVLGCRFLILLGCNSVTRQDALTSVNAGFIRDEISRLWSADDGWSISEREAGFASHLFVARRIPKQ